jgi:hypothetical protein
MELESTEYNTIAAFIEKSLIEAPLHHVSDEKIMAMALALERLAQYHINVVLERTQGEEISADLYPPHPDATPPQP